jgi:hypothetical protein
MKLEGESSPDRAEATPDISLETAASPLEPRSWSVPSPYGAPAAVDSLSTIAAPLLGGFSITLVGVVVQASEKFRFSSIALLLLTVAAVLLLLCVQCGFWLAVSGAMGGGRRYGARGCRRIAVAGFYVTKDAQLASASCRRLVRSPGQLI